MCFGGSSTPAAAVAPPVPPTPAPDPDPINGSTASEADTDKSTVAANQTGRQSLLIPLSTGTGAAAPGASGGLNIPN